MLLKQVLINLENEAVHNKGQEKLSINKSNNLMNQSKENNKNKNKNTNNSSDFMEKI